MSSNEWKKYKIGELYDVFSGLTKPREEFGFGNPFITFKDVFGNYFLPKNITNLVNSNQREIKSCSVKKGDIFLTRTSETLHELGMSSVALKDYPNATFNGFTKRLRLKDNVNLEIDLLFLGYYLRSSFVRNQIAQHSSLTTRASLNSSAINSLEISLPEIQIQTKIGRILKSLDEKIENNLQTNQTLEEIARTIFKEWFVYFYYPNADGSRKHSEFGEIPNDWEIMGIGEVCYVQNGYAFKSNDFKEEGEVGIIKIKNINSNVVDIEKTDFVETNVVERLDKKFKIESGSLLIAMTGAEVGKIGLVPLTQKNLWLNQRVGMFKEKIAGGNLFLYLLLSSDTYQTTIRNSALGSAQPNISASAIESIRAIIPPIELIKQFGEMVNPMFEKILDNLAENETIKITRDSLLPKLMSGEIDVNIPNA
jgi:type I restriction enzyme S subunit